MKQAEHEIITNLERLLADKKIDLFIGYEKSTLPLGTSPHFVYERNDMRKLVWNTFCSNNLAVYIPRFRSNTKGKKPKRIGILCKGCDNRSLVGLIKENQVKRDDLYIIGISCPGMVNGNKMLCQLDCGEVVDFDDDDDSITVKLKKGVKRFEKKEYLYESCRNCAYPTPTMYDVLIRTAKFSPQIITPDPAVKEFRAKKREERWKIFEREISKCIRCYACRKACPNCYCKECFAEQTKPKWLNVTNELPDIMFYHIVRILHQAGRCVDCGTCFRACPMNINLRLFTRMLVDEVKERFGYEPGVSIKEQQPLATFKLDDKEEFMTEPPLPFLPHKGG